MSRGRRATHRSCCEYATLMTRPGPRSRLRSRPRLERRFERGPESGPWDRGPVATPGRPARASLCALSAAGDDPLRHVCTRAWLVSADFLGAAAAESMGAVWSPAAARGPAPGSSPSVSARVNLPRCIRSPDTSGGPTALLDVARAPALSRTRGHPMCFKTASRGEASTRTSGSLSGTSLGVALKHRLSCLSGQCFARPNVGRLASGQASTASRGVPSCVEGFL